MLFLLVVVLIAAADQLFKVWVVNNIALGGVRAFLPGVLRLTYVRNTGAAFSMLKNMSWLLVLVTAAFIIAAAAVLLTKKIKHPLGAWSLCATVGGALGNLIDRLRLGFVVDMFETEFMNFAVFNIADCFLTVGGILFCVYVLFFYGRESKDGNGKASGR